MSQVIQPKPPSGGFLFGLAGWFLGGGLSHLGGNLRFGRKEVSVDDFFLNELD